MSLSVLRRYFRPYIPSRQKCSISGSIIPAGGTGGFDLTFLGTSSQGGARRYPSCLALRLRGASSSQVWLFDAGEGATAQLQRSNMRMSLVRNIFITHLHGDHLYGLPGLVMCILGRKDDNSNTRMSNCTGDDHSQLTSAESRLNIYGPQGIRSFLRIALGVSNFRVPRNDLLHIHELVWPDLCGIASQQKRHHSARPYWRCPTRKLPFEGEGSVIEPRLIEDGVWTYDVIANSCDGRNIEGSPASVMAAPVLHTIPTYAYSVTESVAPMRFNKAKLGLLGVPSDGRAEVRQLFNNWLSGEHGFWRGREIGVDEVLQDGRCARRLCVIGDTQDASMAAHIAQDVDVLVHEATNLAAQTELARMRGHSSTLGATKFAKRVRANRLILNHTSVAYSERKICSMEMEARAMFGSKKVFVARDLSVFSVPTKDEDNEGFVFRRFVGFADSLEYRGSNGSSPFGEDFDVDDEDDRMEGDIEGDEWTEDRGGKAEQETKRDVGGNSDVIKDLGSCQSETTEDSGSRMGVDGLDDCDSDMKIESCGIGEHCGKMAVVAMAKS